MIKEPRRSGHQYGRMNCIGSSRPLQLGRDLFVKDLGAFCLPHAVDEVAHGMTRR